MPRKTALKALLILLKVAATGALFWFVFSKVDFAELAARMSGRQIAAALLTGACVISVQAYLVAHRLRFCARMLGHDVPLYAAWVGSQYAGFFSHTPISFVGGDAMRAWHLVKVGMPLQDAAKAVLLDRALGFMGMMLLVIASVPALEAVIGDAPMRTGLFVVVAGGTLAGVVFLLLGATPPLAASAGILGRVAEFATLSRHLWAHPRFAAAAFALAVAVTGLNVLALWAIGLAYSAGFDLRTAFGAGPIAFLVAMIPISVAGWGLREGAVVVSFGLFGVPAAVSLAASVSYGVGVLLAYLPAPVLWLRGRRQAAQAAQPGKFAPASAPPPGHS